MKTFQATNKTKIAIAVLTNQQKANTALAVLTFSVGVIDHAQSERVQLLPDGEFSAKDGRPFDVVGGKWLMDAQAFANLTISAANRTNDFHFDYEHQTMLSEQNGKRAPAAGWFKNLEYVPGQGLFATNVDWTPDAKKHIDNKEYRYTSAVFAYDKNTGRPISLEHVALTNDPALDGMKAIAALKNAQKNTPDSPPHKTTPTGDKTMNEALKLYLELLGVSINGVDFANEAALKKVQDEGKTALVALKAKADQAGVFELELATAQTSVTALKAKAATADGSVDLSKFVPKATYDAAIEQVAALKATGDSNSVEQLLKDNADKVFESEKDYLTDFGKQQGFAALKAMVDLRPAIVSLKTTQTKGKEKPGDHNVGIAALTSEQKYTADQLGLSHKDFLATLNHKETN